MATRGPATSVLRAPFRQGFSLAHLPSLQPDMVALPSDMPCNLVGRIWDAGPIIWRHGEDCMRGNPPRLFFPIPIPSVTLTAALTPSVPDQEIHNANHSGTSHNVQTRNKIILTGWKAAYKRSQTQVQIRLRIRESGGVPSKPIQAVPAQGRPFPSTTSLDKPSQVK